MAYMSAIGPCIGCGQVFSFNPERVPSSSAVTGAREPICADCYAKIQRKRVKLGLPPHPDPVPGAYEAEEVD